MRSVCFRGCETIQVSDQLDTELKEAMTVATCHYNDCPYCADMLVGMVHSEGNHESAVNLQKREHDDVAVDDLWKEVHWDLSTVGPRTLWTGPPPFDEKELPEALGSVITFGYVNRITHVTMADSPVQTPLGLHGLKRTGLRLLGGELREGAKRDLEPGRAVSLVDDAPLPDDLSWAKPNRRVANALSRWVGVME